MAPKCLDNSVHRAVGRSENPGGGYVVLDGDNVLPLVAIGLTDLPKVGGGTCPSGPPALRGLVHNAGKLRIAHMTSS